MLLHHLSFKIRKILVFFKIKNSADAGLIIHSYKGCAFLILDIKLTSA